MTLQRGGARQQESGAQGKRLLILDDDSAVGQTIARLAQRAGFDVRAVCRPGAFFELLEQWDPTHIALDLVMPEMDGVEIVQLLADRKCSAPVILTSGVGGRVLDAARRSAVEHGLRVAGVLAKPFLPGTVRALLGEELRADKAGSQGPEAAVARAPDLAEPDLRRGIEAGEFTVAYQPKISCATGDLDGFEALARWNHPRLGKIMPERFIPLAESTGNIDALTFQLLDQAVEWLSRFPAPGAGLAVNLSPHSLGDVRLADHIAGLCAARQIDAERVILEMTETATMSDPVAALDLLTRMRMKRFHLSIDDFGTGYSSMLQLVRLPFSEMKVDKSFVMVAAQSAEARAVIRSVVGLGHSLGLKVCAEGVEDVTTLNFLRQIGCDVAQGYLIARPLGAAEVGAWVDEWKRKRQARFASAKLLR